MQANRSRHVQDAVGISALKRGSATDNVLTVAGMIGVSIPEFFFGLVAIALGVWVYGRWTAPGASAGRVRFGYAGLIALLLAPLAALHAAEPLLEKTPVFPPGMNGIARYRIPGIVVTTKGTVLAYSEARRNGSADWGEIEVRVTLGATPATLNFAVRDTGIGIPLDQQEKLFRPFSQVDQQSTRRYGGTGLGLVISRNLVRLMGGEISFVSAKGQGTTFTFSIQAEPVAGVPEPVPVPAGRTLALVARPGPVRTELAALVESWGVRVLVADQPAGLDATADVILVELPEGLAAQVARMPVVPWPLERTIGLVSLTLPAELRAPLRERVAGLLNKPVRHEHLRRLLTSEGPLVHAPQPAVAAEAAGATLRVLLVEDNPVNQRLTQRLLERNGCTWVLAENGRLAIEALRVPGADYDFVLMDMHMPEMDGLTAIRKIRAGEAGLTATDVWIVALTADARAERREEVFDAGANDFLTKPVVVGEFRASLERLRAARTA